MKQFFAAIICSALASSSFAAPRVPWTTSRISGSPEVPPKFKLERHFSDLVLTNAVDLTWNNELRRWFVAEQGGRVLTFDADGRNSHIAAEFGPLQGKEGSLYAITFDPGFATNGFIYACYVLKAEVPDGSHVSRFKVEGKDEPIIDLKSEELLITWLSGGHNGCCLKFGKDDCLYISTGDGAGPNPPDPLRTGQDISDLLSSILRIDVHHKSAGKNYTVPADNPFVNDPKARPEIWAFGFRNPWRMGFDAHTGDLWVGDVGWELWELIYRVKKGGNYGWSIFEGRQPILSDQRQGPGPILPPIKDHPHSESSSVTGGLVYYGAKFPELKGAFLYGDWETGKIWAIRADSEGKPTFSEELLDSTIRVIAFAEDARGEVMVLDYNGGLYSLEPNTSASRPEDFPRKLSETGLFASLSKHELAPGIVPFQVNAEQWIDHAKGERFLALPNLSVITNADKPWRYPSNAVLVRTISMEMERGAPASSKRLETQILHYQGDGWGAYTYRWNADQTDAELVPSEGAQETLRVKDTSEPGGVRVQNWRYHSRTECLRCHNPWCGTALAFQLEQIPSARLEDLVADGYLKTALKEKPLTIVSPHDSSKELNARARSYLHVNCSACHREGAGGSVPAVMNIELAADKMHIIDARPIRGDLGLKNGKVVASGAPFSSVLLFRTSSTGHSRMPYIGSYLVDDEGISLLREWIESLGPQNRSELSELRARLSAPHADLVKISTEHALSTSSALMLAHALTHSSFSPELRERVASTAAKTSNPLVRELFERFLPPDARTPQSQEIAPKEKVLALKGDAARGAALLRDSARSTCLQCHQFQDQGRAFGPPFHLAGQKQSRAELLENILHPSLHIAPEYVLYTAETADDDAISGILVKRTAEQVVLRDASATDHTLSANSIKSLKPAQLSAMPEGLLVGLSAQEVADLLEALLKEAAR